MIHLHVEIANAIQVGIGTAFVRREVKQNKEHGRHTLIYTNECDEPIIVKKDDVILPDELKKWASGIFLDVRTILVERRTPGYEPPTMDELRKVLEKEKCATDR